MSILPSVRVFEADIHLGTYNDILRIVSDAIERGETTAIDTSNTVVVGLAATDKRYREALACFDLLMPDSVPLVWYLRSLGANISGTCFGPETARRVWKRFYGDARIMIVGGDPETKALFESKFGTPCKWVTRKLDPESQADVQRLADDIREADPDIILMGLGCPQSYYLYRELKPLLRRGVVVNVGGSFDLISGRKKLTPRPIQRLGLGWLYRLMHEPRRLWRRYLKFNTLFVYLVLRNFRRDRNRATASARAVLGSG